MAILIPSLNSRLPRMTGGEKRFAIRLKAKLEDDYILWYDVAVGNTVFVERISMSINQIAA